MSNVSSASIQHQMQQIEDLVQQIEASSDPAAQTAAREMVRALLDLHGAGLAKIFDLLSEAGESGRAIIESCAGDELVGSLLLLHDLHPQNLQTRVENALESVRPYLASHGGDVELLGVSGGTVRLRMTGSCDGCPSSSATLQSTIEQAIYDAAPEISGIEVDGLTEPSAPSGLVQLDF